MAYRKATVERTQSGEGRQGQRQGQRQKRPKKNDFVIQKGSFKLPDRENKMTWDLLQTNWPFKDEEVRQPKSSKERWFVDAGGITIFEGDKTQCKQYRRQHGGIVRHYVGVSEEYLALKREETRFKWTGSGTKQTMAPDDSPGVIWMNGGCYKRRQK